ncbi:MAG: polysaccharide biosynthesis C-terminal domain-containing protein [Thermotogae bacterium]|nr:polysaccharide biosynthesis C-terminal domain-containing protein [Thermotogota bacterium]
MLTKKLSKGLTTIDRLLILKFLDARSLGFYSLGNLVFAPLLMVFTASNSVMYPRFAERYGETGDPRSLKRYITVPMEVLSSVMAVLVGAIYIALPLLTKVFLPEYVDGVPAARILMFGLFFYAISGMAGNMLLTINKQVLRLWILLGSALLNFGFSFVALRLGYGIEGVAAGTSMAYFLFFLTISVMAMGYTHSPRKEIGKLLTHVLGVIFYIGIIALLLPTFFSIDVRSSHVVVRIIISELVLAACSSYIIYKLIQRHRIVELIRGRWQV